MKCIVTGSAGFIGSNLTETLLQNGCNVLGLDNFSTGYREMADQKRYARLSGKYSFIEADITAVDAIWPLFRGAEVVFHLAALPRVSYSIDDPIPANHANISGTLSVLEASRRAGVSRVIFSCSSSVYGNTNIFPTPEDSPRNPLSPYALHKETGAEYCKLYSRLHGLETCSLLYFNVFGPHQRADSAYATVIPAFFDAAVNKKSCRIDGTGQQARDFTYVDNVVFANMLAARHKGRLLGDRFNVAAGNSHSVIEVYNTINGFFGGNVAKHYVPKRLGDPFKSCADISKIKRELGFYPKVDFKTGMDRTLDYWKSL